MLEVFDKNRKKVAILQNALNIKETEKINSVNTLSFSLPYSDPKNNYCQPFNYVKSLKGQLYRIMPSEMTRDDTGNISYECEHVIATLIDNVLFGYHVVGNLGYYTRQVIQYILDHQIVKNWTLGRCAFNNQFEYGWEQESLLSALWSVATPLQDDYIFTFDTSSYPWVLHLDKLDSTALPQVYIRSKKNLLRIVKKSDPKEIATRIYPLGYGEGVNQLGIKDVNSGCAYIQSPQSYIDKYGIIERVWIDRRYEDATSLLNAAKTMLKELQEPYVEYSVDFTQIGEDEFSKAEVGKLCRVIDPETGIDFNAIIKGITTDFEDVKKSTLEIANKAQDIAGTIADMADRQRIEMSYSQGATQLYEKSVIDNASPQEGVKANFMIPSDMRIVNKVIAKVSLESFRAYSKATTTIDSNAYSSSDGGGTYTSTEGGGGDYTSTSYDGGIRTTTESGGGGYTTSRIDDIWPGADGHDHGVEDRTRLAIWGGTTTINGKNVMTPDSDKYVVFRKSGNHVHTVEIPNHYHELTIEAHTHSLNLPDHTHNLRLQSHNHVTVIPGHGHEITPTISMFGNPQSFTIYVGDTPVGTYQTRDTEIDITKLILNKENKIPRDSWITLKVVPDDLAHIQIDLHIQGFVQSRGDNTY